MLGFGSRLAADSKGSASPRGSGPPQARFKRGFVYYDAGWTTRACGAQRALGGAHGATILTHTRSVAGEGGEWPRT